MQIDKDLRQVEGEWAPYWSWSLFRGTDDDKRMVEKWLEDHSPVLLASASLAYRDGFQSLVFYTELLPEGGDQVPLYTQGLSVSRDVFEARAQEDPWGLSFFQGSADPPVVLPMGGGYSLEIFLHGLYCEVW